MDPVPKEAVESLSHITTIYNSIHPHFDVEAVKEVPEWKNKDKVELVECMFRNAVAEEKIQELTERVEALEKKCEDQNKFQDFIYSNRNAVFILAGLLSCSHPLFEEFCVRGDRPEDNPEWPVVLLKLKDCEEIAFHFKREEIAGLGLETKPIPYTDYTSEENLERLRRTIEKLSSV